MPVSKTNFNSYMDSVWSLFSPYSQFEKQQKLKKLNEEVNELLNKQVATKAKNEKKFPTFAATSLTEKTLNGARTASQVSNQLLAKPPANLLNSFSPPSPGLLSSSSVKDSNPLNSSSTSNKTPILRPSISREQVKEEPKKVVLSSPAPSSVSFVATPNQALSAKTSSPLPVPATISIPTPVKVGKESPVLVVNVQPIPVTHSNSAPSFTHVGGIHPLNAFNLKKPNNTAQTPSDLRVKREELQKEIAQLKEIVEQQKMKADAIAEEQRLLNLGKDEAQAKEKIKDILAQLNHLLAEGAVEKPIEVAAILETALQKAKNLAVLPPPPPPYKLPSKTPEEKRLEIAEKKLEALNNKTKIVKNAQAESKGTQVAISLQDLTGGKNLRSTGKDLTK